jgi:FHA domain-containing protein
MMLILRAVSLNDLPITQPITARFGAQGGSIGRADSNTLPLPDPERRISRRQADVSVSGSGFAIKNVGSANPIIVRDQSLALGESAPLRGGDQVRIGGYLLEVTQGDGGVDDRTAVDPAATFADPFAAAAAAAAPWSRPAASAPAPLKSSAPAFPSSSPFADLGGAVSAANPFAELLGNPPAPAARAGQPGGADRIAAAPSRLPDDFDPFAPPPEKASAAPPRPSSPGGAFDDLIPSAAPASIDALFGLAPGDRHDSLAAFMAGAAPVSATSSGTASLSTDPLALFGVEKESASRPLPPETSPDHTPELRAGFAPPKIAPAKIVPPKIAPIAAPPPSAAAAPLAPADPSAAPDRAARMPRRPPTAPPVESEESTVPPAVGWSPDALAVWNALCEGAGVRLEPPPNTGPTFMRVVGMMLRASVEGTVQLMAMRQATRQELQAQVTVIRPKNNNPLKFAPDGQSALEQLLQPAVRGFLPGPAAMTDAMNDLLGHAIGTMAGTRAALEGVLKRFGPQELEAKLVDKSVLDSVLPMNRKAKLWELYLQHYESIRDEAQDDFHALFGRAFLAAYEQQLERLRREKSAAPK